MLPLGAHAFRSAEPVELAAYLEASALAPGEYVLSKFDDHRIVILGEPHWVKHHVELVIELIPRLGQVGVGMLATELLPASEQELVTRIVTADEWDQDAAMAVMRVDAWPYREYLEILHAAWLHNRARPPEAAPLQLLALGAGSDWRERLLPLGKDADRFMAERVLTHVGTEGRALVYAGAHHAFTRYHQPELPRGQRVERFMDRMGNILWRERGQDVFMITLHRPWMYRSGERWSYRLPLDARIDCAAVGFGQPLGFDISGSPFADLRILPDTSYALGHPDLRLGDFTDGYIWTKPIEQYEAVELIPLAEFAPDDDALARVAQNNPFSEARGLDRPALEALWKERDAQMHDRRAWSFLFDWRNSCGERP
jgi:hypothetical protein